MSAAAIDLSQEESVAPGADIRQSMAIIKEATSQEMIVGGDPKGQYLYWMVVVNNPQGQANGEGFGLLCEEKMDAEQVVWQIEKGKEGTVHVQAWMKTKTRHRLQKMKNIMRSKVFGGWVMPCRDAQAARKYCEKVASRLEGPWYFGTAAEEKVMVKGQRTDIDKAARVIVDGGSIADVIQEAPGMFVKYHAGLMKLESMVSKPRGWMTEMHILWGVSGSGKSHTAREEAGDGAYYLPVPKKGGPIWWDGYQGEEHVVIEDFYGEIDLQFMLKMVDKYPFKVQVKGAMVEFRAKKIWITSNSNWELWYSTEFMRIAEHKTAFNRRITSVREYSTRYVEPKGDKMLPVDDLTNEEEEIDLTSWVPRIMLNDRPMGMLPIAEEDESLVPFNSVINGQKVDELSVSELDFLSDIEPERRVEALNWFRDQ